MDKYGGCEITKEDADLVRSALEENGSVVFSLSGDKITALVICLTQNPKVLGVIPFGGNPRGRIWLSILMKGSEHFLKGPTHASYFKEQLNIPLEEAEWLSEFWGLMWGIK